MMSMLGTEESDAAKFRYDGMVSGAVSRAGSGQRLRHGRGLCQWKVSLPRESERDTSGSASGSRSGGVGEEVDKGRVRGGVGEVRLQYYDGFWEHNNKAGQAMIRFADGSIFEGCYKLPAGPQGYGRMAYADGAWYEGSWHKGKKHGYGYMWWADKNEAHQGEFANDLPHGHGIRYYPNGEVYQGGWSEGAKHGVGVVESITTVDDVADTGISVADRKPSADGISVSQIQKTPSVGHLQKSALRRVTSHATFQLEVTDDEEDWDDRTDKSHNSSVSEQEGVDQKSRKSVLARGENLPRRDSTSSMLGGGGGVTRTSSVRVRHDSGGGGGGGEEDPHTPTHTVKTVKVSRRCIDGIPLDEFATCMGGRNSQSTPCTK